MKFEIREMQTLIDDTAPVMLKSFGIRWIVLVTIIPRARQPWSLTASG